MERIRNTFFAIFAVCFLAAAALLMTLMWFDLQAIARVEAQQAEMDAIVIEQAATLTQAARYTPPPTEIPLPTNTPFPTATPTPPLMPLAERRATTVAQATATAAVRSSGFNAAKSWGIIVRDSFNTSSVGWQLTDGDPELALMDRRIENGKMSWAIESYSDLNIVEPLPDLSLDTVYYLGVDIEQSNASQNNQGIVFNYQDTSNYMLFSTCASPNSLGAFRYENGVWFTLHACRPSDTLRTEGPNTLSIIAHDNYYQFFVNSSFVADLWDDTFSGGSAGVHASMAPAQSNVFLFDNFEVRLSNE